MKGWSLRESIKGMSPITKSLRGNINGMSPNKIEKKL